MMSTLLQKLLVVLFCGAAMLIEPSCIHDSYEVKLSGPVTIGNEWVELTPEKPLRADKTFQWIVLELETPFKDDLYREGTGPNRGAGILMPDGDVVNPDIQVIDEYGNIFK